MKQITIAEKQAQLNNSEVRKVEFRKSEIRAEIRKENENEKGKMILRGYPILFNEPTTIYTIFGDEIKETILPTALDRTDLSNVYLFVGHNPDNLIGRAGINMRLEKDETGLFFECEIPNTQYARDWYNLVQDGIVDGMSFGFISGDQVNWENNTRTITDIIELYEITITPFPAYKLASVVAKQENADKDITQPDEEVKKADKQVDTDKEEVKKADSELEKKLKKLEEM
jgi:uncharacterized protein